MRCCDRAGRHVADGMAMTAARRWRSYGDDALPTGAEALAQAVLRISFLVFEGHLPAMRAGAHVQ